MTLSTSQTRIINIFNNFRRERNEPQPCPSRGENSSIHSILYIPIVPVQSFCILHHYQSSINSFKIHTMLFPLLIIVTILIVHTVSFPTVSLMNCCVPFVVRKSSGETTWDSIFRKTKILVICVREALSIHPPRVAGTDQETLVFISAFLLLYLTLIRSWNHLRLSVGALLPTALSDHTWDYEVQSENQPNPQLEELNKKE